MNDDDRKRLKRRLERLCSEIGCSGVSHRTCPGDPACKILRKLESEACQLVAIGGGTGDEYINCRV